ncbi:MULTISPECIES: hypothetical protein [Methylomonas]|uniref:hypothetical protein n=1 Tax=Methylomonas TaxID=416 RepID=UPI001231A48F|nr:hypothetical protein [Methylomonas rhizoryzae]
MTIEVLFSLLAFIFFSWLLWGVIFAFKQLFDVNSKYYHKFNNISPKLIFTLKFVFPVMAILFVFEIILTVIFLLKYLPESVT